jgi:hypothetical protein
MKRRNDTADEVSATDLLADYVVTRPPTMTTSTGLPPVAMPDEAPEPEAPPRPVFERRTEPRIVTVRRVAASHPGGEYDLKGVTNNISASGMSLLMPEPPPAAHQDVVVTDNQGSSSVWIQVISHRVAPTDGYVWHVRVTASDSEWENLLARASAPANSTRRKDRKRDAAAS